MQNFIHHMTLDCYLIYNFANIFRPLVNTKLLRTCMSLHNITGCIYVICIFNQLVDYHRFITLQTRHHMNNSFTVFDLAIILNRTIFFFGLS